MVSGDKDQPMPPPQLPFHLLEINIISAQELFSSSLRSRPAYALAWIHPSHKLSTGLDTSGGADPTWNDKFVFRVNDDFLRSETSAVMIQIYASRRLLPDNLLGTVRVVLSAHHPSSSTRFVALQVRRPSCRPQGILNIGLALLDAYIRRVPIYSELHASAFAYKDLMLGSPSRSSSDLSRAIAAEASGGCQDLLLPRSGSVAVGSWVVEMERAALQSKLDKWRTELPEIPDREAQTAENGEGRRRRKRRSALCCCVCGVREPPWMRMGVKPTIAC